MFSRTVLNNGLRVLTVPMPQIQSVTALVLIKTGSRYETKENNGISHFLEHLSFKGTKSRPDQLAISNLLDGLGGVYNAFTGKEYTGFYIKAESRHLSTILDVLTDILQNSLYDQASMDVERGVIIEEINMYEDQPQELVGEYFEELLYGDNPLGWRVLGSKENISKITRDQIIGYVKEKYVGKNMVLALAGQAAQCHPELVPPQRDPAMAVISGSFSQVSSGQNNNFREVVDRQQNPKSLVVYKKSDQAHLVLGNRAYKTGHPDRYILSVLATILGEGMSSRLFQEVRVKRGLAYYVGTNVAQNADCGYFAVHAGVAVDKAEQALKIILEELVKSTKSLVTSQELERAKNFTRGHLVMSLESSNKMASFFAAQELLEDKIETPEQILEHIDGVTVDDIKRVANDIFINQKLNLALIGPFQEKEKFSTILSF